MTQANKKNISLQLRQELQIQRYPVVAEITIDRERPDVAKLLQRYVQSADIPARLRDYLQREQLVDAFDGQLTEYGKQVRDTQQMKTKERGLYHIWYLVDHKLLGTRPLVIQRDNAIGSPKGNVWKRGVDAEVSGFSVAQPSQSYLVEEVLSGNQSRQTFEPAQVISIKPEVICAQDFEETIHLDWHLSDRHSKVSLEGKIDTLAFRKDQRNGKKVGQSHNFQIDIEDHHQSLFDVLSAITPYFDGEWDQVTQRMAIKSNTATERKALAAFALKGFTIQSLATPVGDYQLNLKTIPAEPCDEEDAKAWQLAWLKQRYEQKYLGHVELHREQAKWLDHPAVSRFNLPLKVGEELLRDLRHEGDSEVFWRVAALSDLTPARSKRQRLPITLIDGDRLDIGELVTGLTMNRKVQFAIYSDRYVYTRRQCENLTTIHSAGAIQQGLLMTLQPEKNANRVTVPAGWHNEFMPKQHVNHGRYWVFLLEDDVLCWEVTCGLDFIQRHESGLRVAGQPSFMPKELKELPDYLQQAANNIRAKEAVE
ncbi:hypothetical protein [Vibrio sp. PNB22_8_1]|uniref:hypothetical protein n=1 Tax=unclassified Vibrio TaxID=2614977 RepID=UPI00406A90DA